MGNCKIFLLLSDNHGNFPYYVVASFKMLKNLEETKSLNAIFDLFLKQNLKVLQNLTSGGW